MIYAGIDYSINCPCICIHDTNKGNLCHESCLYFFTQNKVSKREQKRRNALNMENIFPATQSVWNNTYQRYMVLADFFLSIMIQYDVKIVSMEDYSMGSKGRIFNIAECTAILKMLMTLAGIKFYSFPPMYVKKIFSSKGSADKNFMIQTYKLRYNIDIPQLFGKPNSSDSPISDIVDSHAMLYTFLNGDLKKGR